MEKFTPLAKILHCRRQWRDGQIPPLGRGGTWQGVGRKSSVIGAWQKAPSRGTLPHSQPTFAIETHIHIYYMWHTISSQQGWTGKLFFSRGGEGHGARPKIYGAGRVLTIFIHPCFPIFCKMLKTSNEKAWMKSGTLRMMTLSSKSLRTNRGPGDLWNAKHFNKGLINFNACYAAFVKEEWIQQWRPQIQNAFVIMGGAFMIQHAPRSELGPTGRKGWLWWVLWGGCMVVVGNYATT